MRVARRRLAVRELVRRHGGPGARLFLVRANLASFTDVDRLVEWLGAPRDDEHPGLPDVVLPFAAAPVAGDVPDTGARQEIELRVLLLGVERLVGRLAEASGRSIGSHRLTAVLPMSPNHGTFGGDGSYGEAKAGLEVLEIASAFGVRSLGSPLPHRRRRDRVGARYRPDGRQRRTRPAGGTAVGRTDLQPVRDGCPDRRTVRTRGRRRTARFDHGRGVRRPRRLSAGGPDRRPRGRRRERGTRSSVAKRSPLHEPDDAAGRGSPGLRLG